MRRHDSWNRRVVVAGLIGLCWITLGPACSGPESGRRSPVAPSAVSGPRDSMTSSAASATSAGQAQFVAGIARAGDNGGFIPVLGALPGVSAPSDIVFPPRSEPLLFRTALEAQYRDVLRRSAVPTFVDQEGTVVWVQEYLRYRVNGCSHAEATLRVFRQIDGQGIQPVCASATTAIFPPRQEPLDYMIQLEAKYRDGLRRTAGLSFVDVEGNVIWTQEYMRYRVSTCSHAEAQQKVFDQIAGRGVGADCVPLLTVIGAACACVSAPIQIRIGNAIVGNISCNETRSFPVPAGPYLVTACTSRGCFGGNYFGPYTGNAVVRLIC